MNEAANTQSTAKHNALTISEVLHLKHEQVIISHTEKGTWEDQVCPIESFMDMNHLPLARGGCLDLDEYRTLWNVYLKENRCSYIWVNERRYNMPLFNDIKTGLNQAIKYEKGNLKVRATILKDEHSNMKKVRDNQVEASSRCQGLCVSSGRIHTGVYEEKEV